MLMTTATPADLIELWQADGLTVGAGRYRAFIGQMVAGDAFAVRHEDDPAPVAIGGVVPLERGIGDTWLVCSERLPRYIVPVVLLARASLRSFVRGPHSCLWTWVKDENPAGRRLAWMIGFHATGDLVSGHRRWEMIDGGHASRQQGAQDAAGGA